MVATNRTGDLAESAPKRMTTLIPRVLHAVLAHGEAQPNLEGTAELAQASRRSVGVVVKRLEARRILARKPLRFGPGLLTLSIAAGSETMRGALVDANGVCHHGFALEPDHEQLGTHKQPAEPAILLNRLREVAVCVLESAIADPMLVDNAGCLRLLEATVAWPTAIDRGGKAFGHVLKHRDWHGDTLRGFTAAALGGPFVLPDRIDQINNANAVALGVCFDLTRGRTGEPDGKYSETILAIRVGGGVGAGTVKVLPHKTSRLAFVDSRLIAGSNGLAGELGHLPISGSVVANINAERGALGAISSKWECSCGRNGHLESMTGARALMRRLKATDYTFDEHAAIGPQIDKLFQDPASAASATTPAPNAILTRSLEDTGRLLGRALASPILMLNPEKIVLAGYLARPEVVRGINMEESMWSTGVTNSVTVEYISGTRNGFDDNDYADVRGAALAVFRRRFYRHIDTHAADPTWWDRLGFTFTPADLSEVVASG